MQAAAPAPELSITAPAFAASLRAILTGLAALVASAFLRDPRHVHLIVPLWTSLNRTAARADRLMARLAAGILPRRAAAPATSLTPRPRTRLAPPPSPFPIAKAWLVVALRHHGAAYTCRLRFLLDQPGMADLVANNPQAARLVRPLCRMLGVTHPALVLPPRPRPTPNPHLPARPLPAAHREPPFREVRETHPPAALSPVVMPPPPCPRVRWPWFTGRAPQPPPRG